MLEPKQKFFGRLFVMKYIKSLAVAAAVAAVSTVSANAATIVVPLTAGPDGSLSGGFTQHVLTPTFDDTFIFTLPTDGTASASVITIAVNAATNINFTSAFLNGAALTLGGSGSFEFATISDFDVMAGDQMLRITGTSGGNGDYSGTFVFTPLATAVPEPGIWALLILGFGLVGFATRRTKAVSLRATRTKVSFG